MNKFAAKPYLQRIWPDFGDDVDFDCFPFNIPAVRDLQQIEFHADVTFFVGENGSGKSTILEAIALALGFGVEGGPLSMQLLNTSGERSPLSRHIRMSRSVRRPRYSYFLRAESFYNVATWMDSDKRYRAAVWRQGAARALARRGFHERPARQVQGRRLVPAR